MIQAAGATGLAVGLAIGGYGAASAASAPSAASAASAPALAPAAPAVPDSAHRGMRPGLAAAATALHLSVTELQARLAAGKTIAAIAADQHVPVSDVIDAMVADAQAGLRERITAEVNGNGPVRAARGRRRPADLGVVATALGMTPTEVRTALENGQSIADVARAKHVDPQTVIDALIKDRTAKLDQAVKDGRITQAQADRVKATLPQRVADQVNKVHKPHPAGTVPGPA
ncbi:MAG: hypothetical protein NVS1B12_07770 [Acidimicrobiales bacterium]